MTIENMKEHDGPVIDTVNGSDIIDCRHCGFIHVWPFPTPEKVEALYTEQYYAEEKPDYFSHYEQDRDWWNLVYDDRFDLFEGALPPERRRLLDIGSGPGLFLARGRERGWSTLGIEPSTQAAAYARGMGLEIRNEFLAPDTQGLGRFDAIHLSLVLEHIPDPTALLRQAYDMLDPGGMICVVVPNDYNPIQLVARDACGLGQWWVGPPHHLNYFTPTSLNNLLMRVGFDSTTLSGTFPIDLFLLMGDDYTHNPDLGRACHAKRKALEFAFARAGQRHVRKALYESLIGLGIGREVVVCGRKP